eukprot:49631_1
MAVDLLGSTCIDEAKIQYELYDYIPLMSTQNPSEEFEQFDTFDATQNPECFIKIYDELKYDIEKFENDALDIRKLTKRYTETLLNEEHGYIMQEFNSMLSSCLPRQIKKNLMSEKNKIDKYMGKNKGSTIGQWRENLLNYCTQRFRLTSLDFSQQLYSFKAALREKQRSYIDILDNNKLSEQEKETMLDNYDSAQTFIQEQFALIQSSDIIELVHTSIDRLAELELKHASQGISQNEKSVQQFQQAQIAINRLAELQIIHAKQGRLKIENSVQQFQEMWIQLNAIVSEQQNMLHQIMTNVKNTSHYCSNSSVKKSSNSLSNSDETRNITMHQLNDTHCQTDIYKEGNLQIEADGLFSNRSFKNRWAILNAGILNLYKKKRNKSPAESIDLISFHSIKPVYKSNSCIFHIISNSALYIFSCKSIDDMNAWIASITNAMPPPIINQGYLKMSHNNKWVMFRGNELHIYETKISESPSTIIDMRNCYTIQENKKQSYLSFSILSDTKQHIFAAWTIKDKIQWIKLIDAMFEMRCKKYYAYCAVITDAAARRRIPSELVKITVTAIAFDETFNCKFNICASYSADENLQTIKQAIIQYIEKQCPVEILVEFPNERLCSNDSRNISKIWSHKKDISVQVNVIKKQKTAKRTINHSKNLRNINGNVFERTYLKVVTKNWLNKRTFKHRWGKLKKGHLCLYKKKTDKSASEIIDLSLYHTIKPINVFESGLFMIVSDKNELQFIALSNEEMNQWINIISELFTQRCQRYFKQCAIVTNTALSRRIVSELIQYRVNVKAWDKQFSGSFTLCGVTNDQYIKKTLTEYLQEKYHKVSIKIEFETPLCDKQNSINVCVNMIKYKHNIASREVTCPIMNKLKSNDPLHCHIYYGMKQNYEWNKTNLQHMMDFTHFKDEYSQKSVCKYGDSCKTFVRQQNQPTQSNIKDKCHTKIYRHPPRRRQFQLAEDINYLVVNKSDRQNHPLYKPTDEDSKINNHRDGYLNALISE